MNDIAPVRDEFAAIFIKIDQWFFLDETRCKDCAGSSHRVPSDIIRRPFGRQGGRKMKKEGEGDKRMK